VFDLIVPLNAFVLRMITHPLEICPNVSLCIPHPLHIVLIGKILFNTTLVPYVFVRSFKASMWRDGLSSLGFLSQAFPILSPLNSPTPCPCEDSCSQRSVSPPEVPACLINIVESCWPWDPQGLGVFAAAFVQLLGQFLEI
jgi:hypothetical protein